MGSRPFKDNVVVVTGASSGIGRALALELAEHGAWLVLAARSAERITEVAGLCRERSARAVAVPTDVAVRADCARLMEHAVTEYGRIDTLVNNAGISMWARFDEITDLDLFERLMDVNYFGSVACTHYALPHLKRSRGRIVGVSSVTGLAGVPTRTGYGATKHALAGFFDSLRIELADSGVSVTMIYPDFVASEMRERALGTDGRPLGTSPVDERRIMTAEECACRMVVAMAGRRRELVTSGRARLGRWLKLIAPSVLDGIARRAIEKTP